MILILHKEKNINLFKNVLAQFVQLEYMLQLKIKLIQANMMQINLKIFAIFLPIKVTVQLYCINLSKIKSIQSMLLKYLHILKVLRL